MVRNFTSTVVRQQPFFQTPLTCAATFATFIHAQSRSHTM